MKLTTNIALSNFMAYASATNYLNSIWLDIAFIIICLCIGYIDLGTEELSFPRTIIKAKKNPCHRNILNKTCHWGSQSYKKCHGNSLWHTPCHRIFFLLIQTMPRELIVTYSMPQNFSYSFKPYHKNSLSHSNHTTGIHCDITHATVFLPPEFFPEVALHSTAIFLRFIMKENSEFSTISKHMDINFIGKDIIIILSFGINQLIKDVIQGLIVGSCTCVCMWFIHYWFYLESNSRMQWKLILQKPNTHVLSTESKSLVRDQGGERIIGFG